MPTISQLPAVTAVSAADTVPISQGGTARSASIGAILRSAQPVITVNSQSLIGRTSLGAGGPEQIEVGAGLALDGATLTANGLDHANFSSLGTLDLNSDLVVSLQGSPMLMSAPLLRGLFRAGQNVTISASGVISVTGNADNAANFSLGSAMAALAVVTQPSAGDLLPIDQSGSTCAITYGSLLNGLTIDQAQQAGPVGDADAIWAAQGSSTMASQSFAAIWSWINSKLPLYRPPVTEIAENTVLDTNLHNATVIVCSRPVTVTAPVGTLSSGFSCKVVNASNGTVSLGTGIVTSTGTPTLNTLQSATVLSLTFSGGTITYASFDLGPGGNADLPGPPGELESTAVGATSITLTWQAPVSGPTPSGYIVQSRVSGSSSWTSWPLVSSPSFQISTLATGTSYDIIVQAATANGVGPASNILTVSTAAATQATAPAQVTGVTVPALSSSTVQIAWLAASGPTAALSFTLQYRISGTSSWTWTVTGLTGSSTTVTGLQASTSYDFVVSGINGSGSGPASSAVTAVTAAASGSVSAISWNLLPTGTYTKSSGTVGLNAHVTPATAAIQFGFSQSDTVPPSSWTPALHINSDLWGAYVPTPDSAGSWYAWAEGTDGSALAASSTPFAVQ